VTPAVGYGDYSAIWRHRGHDRDPAARDSGRGTVCHTLGCVGRRQRSADYGRCLCPQRHHAAQRKIEGYIRRVPMNDFQQVKEGDLLIEIEDNDYGARLAQAEAELAGAEAAIANLKSRKALQHSQIAEAQDAINATQADVDRTHKEAVRQRALLASTFGTPQKVEQAVADERRFEANLAHGEAALAAAQRQMAVLDTEEGQLRAAAKAKQAALDLAKIELGYTRIAAPIDGMVSERGVRTGQYVHDGTQVISVVPLHNVWVIANYKETQLTHVKRSTRFRVSWSRGGLTAFPRLARISQRG
jgi:membrane fusion protein, multidrug efflux system